MGKGPQTLGASLFFELFQLPTIFPAACAVGKVGGFSVNAGQAMANEFGGEVFIFHQDDSVETLLFRIPSRVLPFCPNLKIIREELARESVGFFTCGDDFLRSDPEDVSLHVVALRNACVSFWAIHKIKAEEINFTCTNDMKAIPITVIRLR